MIVYELLLAKDIMLAASRYFNAAIFFIYGSVNVVRIILTVFSNQENSYIGQSFTIISSNIFAIVISNLWIFGLIIMVNQRLDNENELEKEKLQLIFNTSTNAQSITRMQDSFILDVNDEFAELTGYSKHEVIGKTTKEMGFWTNSKDRDIFVTQLNAQGICKSMESVFKRKDDTYFDGIISARTIRIHGETHIISVVRDETERKRFENAILESEEKYRSILNASPDDITITNFSGDILMVSPAAKEMFGYDHGFEGFIGMKLLDFLVPEDVERAKANILGMNNGNTGNTNEYRAVRQDKSIIDIEVNSGLIYNAQGIPDKIVFIIRDISARKAIELQLGKVVKQLEIEKNIAQRNAITDSLTGLYNRGYFDNKLRTEFSELSNSGLSLSLIMLDIDYFKKFNDNYGHLAGDKCIQMVTTMLKNKIEGTHDIVARYGGEEFIVILPGTGENEAKIIGEEVRQAVEDLDIPHMASNTVNHVTVSVGIVTVYPEDLASPDDALKMVDDTLYQAKENGRNCCVFNSVREQDVALA
ncbi:MAG: diguanylate cyclase [Clostridium sp.]|nr:diguanylate cyclase [Clostridium sp.]